MCSEQKYSPNANCRGGIMIILSAYLNQLIIFEFSTKSSTTPGSRWIELFWTGHTLTTVPVSQVFSNTPSTGARLPDIDHRHVRFVGLFPLENCLGSSMSKLILYNLTRVPRIWLHTVPTAKLYAVHASRIPRSIITEMRLPFLYIFWRLQKNVNWMTVPTIQTTALVPLRGNIRQATGSEFPLRCRRNGNASAAKFIGFEVDTGIYMGYK